MRGMRINLLVLRTARTATMLDFYRALGLSFVEEQHGSGPRHWSCERDGMVIEIFPGPEGIVPDWKSGGATNLGFSVESIDATMSALAALPSGVVSPTQPPRRDNKAVLFDPDGRWIYLTEPARS